MGRHGTNPVKTKSIARNLKGQKKERTKKSYHQTVLGKQGGQAHLALASVIHKTKKALDCEQSLFGQSRLSSAGPERGGKKRDCTLFCNRRVQISLRPQHRKIGLVDKQYDVVSTLSLQFMKF